MKPLAVYTTGRPVPKAEAAGGSFYDMIARGIGDEWTAELVDVDCASGGPLLLPGEVSGIVVTGSPAHVWHREPWVLALEENLRVHHAAETPLLGICFGHQALGSALGGVTAPHPRGREIGTPELELLENDELFAELDDLPRFVPMSHLDSVVELPKGARALARTAHEPHAAVRFGPLAWGVQFHPEMDDEIIGHYIQDRREAIAAEGFDIPALLAARRPSPIGPRLLGTFARLVLGATPSRA